MANRRKPDVYHVPKRGPSLGVDTPCGKKGYASASDADRVREHREEGSGDKIAIYSCERCGKWHLTSATW